MKKIALALAVLMLIGLSAGVVGSGDCPEGEMCIQDSGGDDVTNDSSQDSDEDGDMHTMNKGTGLLDSLFSFLGSLV